MEESGEACEGAATEGRSVVSPLNGSRFSFPAMIAQKISSPFLILTVPHATSHFAERDAIESSSCVGTAADLN